MILRRYPHEYFIWRAIIGRCTKPHYPRYERYGGRGIIVCERWSESYSAFISDIGPRPSPDHSIDRLDNDGNYEPSNCRWATRAQQAQNTSRTVLNWSLVTRARELSAAGLSQRKIAAKFGLKRGAVRAAIEGRSWSVDDVARGLA